MPQLWFPADQSNRRHFGGTDANKLMTGGGNALWRVFTGRDVREDLSGIFRVQLGIFTERFNLDWLLAHVDGIEERARGDNRLCTTKDMLDEFGARDDGEPRVACSPDLIALYNGVTCYVDAKHTNAFSKPDRIYETYYWQMVHDMLHTGSRTGMISPIYGNGFGEPVLFEADSGHEVDLVEAITSFLWHVEHDIEYDAKPTEAIAAPALKRVVRILGQNWERDWLDQEDLLDTNETAFKSFQTAQKTIRKLVPDDAAQVIGAGFQAIVDGRGTSIRRLGT